METSLTLTVLVENTPVADLASEHGLSLHLRYTRGNRVLSALLDFGQSDAFAQNARALGIDLPSVDLAVLSHAHYDHANGMPAFFAANDQAPLYLSETCGEDCWSTKGGTVAPHYIGIEHRYLAEYRTRMRRVPSGQPTTLEQGVHLLPHTTPGLSEIGRTSGMLRDADGRLTADDFSHELSLVFELEPATDGTLRLAVFNSCSHAGVPAIMREVRSAFPDAQTVAYAGGLHLVHADDTEVGAVAATLQAASVEKLLTGHCTGDRASRLLAHALPGRVHALYPGLQHALS